MIGIVSVWNQKKTDYWVSIYNRVLLHYSVSIAAAASTTAHIHLSAEAAAVYIPVSAAAAAHSPRSTIKITPPRVITHFRSYDVNSCDVTSRNVTFGHVTSGSHDTYGHTQWYILYYYYGKKKAREYAEHTSGSDVTSGHVTHVTSFPVRAASGDVTSSNPCVIAFAPPEICLELSRNTTLIFGFGGSL